MPFLGFPRTSALLTLTLSFGLLGACSSPVPVQHNHVPINDANDIESPAPVPTATPVPASVIVSPSPAATPMPQQSASAVSVSFRTLAQTHSFNTGETSRAIGNGMAFTDFWRRYVTNLDGVPTIDFGSQTVLAIFAGPQRSGGYTTSVISVQRSGNHLKVRYRVDPPAIASAPSSANPVHVVVVSSSLARGDFEVVDYERVF